MTDTALARVRHLVWNADQRRLRTPLRLPLGVAVLFLVGLAVAVGAEAARGLLPVAVPGGLAGQVVSTVVATAVPVAGVAAVGRWLDRRRFVDFGFHLSRGWWLDCGFGMALGAGLMAGVFLLELAAGWVTVTGLFVVETGGSFGGAFGTAVVLFVGVSLREELLLRGYFLTNLAEGGLGIPRFSPRGAVVAATVVSSGVFGLLHAANPNATALSTASIGLAGVFLALGYLLTGELAIPLGLHFTWNLFQGTVFGFPVSGLGPSVSVVGVEQSGPALATGGAFGPEAGLTGIAAMLVGGGLTVAWVRWRTGSVALSPAVWTPELRWRSATDAATDRSWESDDEWAAGEGWEPGTERMEAAERRTEPVGGVDPTGPTAPGESESTGPEPVGEGDETGPRSIDDDGRRSG